MPGAAPLTIEAKPARRHRWDEQRRRRYSSRCARTYIGYTQEQLAIRADVAVSPCPRSKTGGSSDAAISPCWLWPQPLV